MLTTTNPTAWHVEPDASGFRIEMDPADPVLRISERRQFIACQRHAIEHALLTDGTAAEGEHIRRAAEALMIDVVMAPDGTPLLRLLCELYRMVAAGEPEGCIGAAVVEFVRGNVRLAAEINWQAAQDGEGGKAFAGGRRYG